MSGPQDPEPLRIAPEYKSNQLRSLRHMVKKSARRGSSLQNMGTAPSALTLRCVTECRRIPTRLRRMALAAYRPACCHGPLLFGKGSRLPSVDLRQPSSGGHELLLSLGLASLSLRPINATTTENGLASAKQQDQCEQKYFHLSNTAGPFQKAQIEI